MSLGFCKYCRSALTAYDLRFGPGGGECAACGYAAAPSVLDTRAWLKAGVARQSRSETRSRVERVANAVKSARGRS